MVHLWGGKKRKRNNTKNLKAKRQRKKFKKKEMWNKKQETRNKIRRTRYKNQETRNKKNPIYPQKESSCGTSRKEFSFIRSRSTASLPSLFTQLAY